MSSEQSSGDSFEQTPSISSIKSGYSKYLTDFEEIEKIGKGGFGTVFKCQNKLDELVYAVKKIPFSPTREEDVLREVRLLCRAQHEHVVRYYHVWIEDEVEVSSCGRSDTESSEASSAPMKTLYLLMECCDSTLKEHLEKGIDRSQIWHYFRGIVKGLCHIHAKGIVHRDISKDNIFFDTAGRTKIGDFGLAILLEHVSAGGEAVGNPMYQAPETKNESILITNKVDIYCIGLILLEMLYPMKTIMERDDVIEKIRNEERPDNWEYGDSETELVFNLLHIQPSERPSASEILITVANWG